MRSSSSQSKWFRFLNKTLALALAASFVFPPGFSARLASSRIAHAGDEASAAVAPSPSLAERLAAEQATLDQYALSAGRIAQAFEGQPITDPLDPYQLSLQVVEKLKNPGSISRDQIHVRLIQDTGPQAGAEVGRVNRADHRAGMGYAEPRSLPALADGGRIELWSQETRIQTLNADALAVGILGDYLVFIEKNQYTALESGGGIQTVHFVDLKYFDRAIGRNELPVFRMGVKVDAPATTLVAHGDVLVAGSGEISRAALRRFSEVQQWGFNLAVAMVDPAFQKEHGSAAEALLQTFDAAFEYAGKARDADVSEALSVDQEIYLADLVQGVAGSLNATQAALSMVPKTRAAELAALEKEILAETTRASVNAEAAKLETDSQFLAEAGVPAETRERFMGFMRDARAAQSAQTQASAIAAQIKAGRTTRARLGEVILAASLPKPTQAGTIKEALALFASGAKRLITNNGVAGTPTANPALADVREGLAQLASHPWARAGAGVAAAAFLGTYYPTETVAYVGQGLHAAAEIADASAGYVGNLVSTYGKAAALGAIDMTEGLRHPIETARYYTSAENLPLLAEGLGALTKNALMVFGIPHLTVNAAALAVDLYRKGFGLTDAVPAAPEGETSAQAVVRWIRAIPSIVSAPVRAFIERQVEDEKTYYQRIAENENKAGKPSFTDEQEAEVAVRLAEVKRQNQGWIGGFVEKARTAVGAVKDKVLGALFKKKEEKSGPKGVMAFAKATKDFLIGLPGLTRTFQATAWTWNNVIYALRTMVWYPTTLLPTYLMFPEYILTAIKNKGQVLVPTELNGGTRSLPETLKLWLQGLADPEVAQARADFEDSAIAAEALIQVEALRVAREATIRFVAADGEALSLLEAGAIRSVSDPALAKLPRKARTYFRIYFDTISKAATKRLVEDLAIGKGADPLTAAATSITEMKAALVAGKERISVTAEEARRYVTLGVQDAGERAMADATRAAGTLVDPQTFLTQKQYQVLQEIDPSVNWPITRVGTVNRLIDNPSFFQRIVFKQKMKWLIDYPMELMFMLVLFAGVTQGELSVLQATDDPAVSFHHLSRILFASWAVNMWIDMFANAWLEIQTLARQSDDLGEVPGDKNPDEKNISYLRWLWKQFLDPENSFVQNYKDIVTQSFGNLKPFLTMYVVTSLLTWGRFELDYYLYGYLMVATIQGAITGMSYKLENAFERAQDYEYKDFDEWMRKHPKVAEYLSGIKESRRFKWNLFFFRSLWENPIGFFMSFMSAAQLAGAAPRSLVRAFFAGMLPTEMLDGFAKWVATFVEPVTGSAGPKLISACEELFTNNHPTVDPREKVPAEGGGGTEGGGQ